MASKTDYFNQMYEYARQAGLSDHLARLAVTQSALETGYGRSVKGNNYFGIKAGKSWNGPSQTFKTWEDVGGKRVNITDKFRKYYNPVDAFKDWEKMIGKRWPAALTAKDLPSAIDGLKYGQQGGYASDQKYKQKLMSIDRQGQRLYNNAPLFAGDIPIPTPRQPMFMMAKAIEADRTYNPGGIVGAKAISLNPVSSAQAGEMPKITRSPLPAIRNGWTPADQTDRWNAPIVPGNIDLNNRPIVKNSDGSISTVKSASFGIDGREVLLPTVSPSGVKLTDKGALSLYNATGKNLGQFRDANAANIYAQKLHEDQAAKYLPKTAAKTSTGVGYSLPKAQPTSQFAATPQRTQRALPNVASSAYSDARPMPTGTIPQRVSAPVQSTPAPRYNPLPSGPVAPSVSPATMAAAYGQYGQTRMAAPATPMRANPVAAPFTVKATAGNMTTPIPGPLSNAPIQAPVAATTGQFKKFTPIQKIQQKLKTAVEPENLKAMGGQLAGGAAGSLLGGPIGGILGGLIGKQIMSQPQGQGLLAGLFGGGNNGYQGQSTYIGNGVNAVDRAMYGNRAGDTATYNSQGGGTVTNLGNGSSQRTSSKYGWTETTHADGSKSIKYK